MLKTVLFDIDGVLLSEERCFDASALAVWELLHSPRYLGIHPETFTPNPEEALIRHIRQEVFDHEHVLTFMKSRGMNSNWDMVFLTFSYHLIQLLDQVPTEIRSLILDQKDVDRETLKMFGAALPKEVNISYSSFVMAFAKSKGTKQDLLLYLNVIAKEKWGATFDLFSRSGPLWKIAQETYQEWYLGDAFIETSIEKKAYQPGKTGFLQEEIPLAEPAALQALFQSIKAKGLTIGIGTGRPYIESYEPLKALGLLDYIDSERLVTSTDVLRAEKAYPKYAPLGKPNPYCYIHGYFGRNINVKEILEKPLPLAEANQLLIIGDSLADCLAAQEMGSHFIAVLTGLTGEDARAEFEAHQAEFILSSVLDVESVINKLLVN
ncbi:phosphoglycolate phosphatase-like HAD superfamily hydrolase [Pullulanibacillus pueri]|uniref:Haloacid dehalogenase n=1 Tax=Pullulanibacillus pueri TaxID=1437324 RepID=A0A8J3EM07_9BACL|nr:HAD hydrolase-like protein [Pullulanibacillus pueri]MBM7682344.1 phosphoglycolate phosphatase-like HAD superfamily hydrolase [Pullulanibacillus pueri]GGH80722.1 haloacid dehalogenase [Pullulanibacillus pueri]